MSRRRILVTGAGGSVGSECCLALERSGEWELTCLDRDESLLHALELRLWGTGTLERPELVLADLRDFAVMSDLVRDLRPHAVIHAGALKHVPMLERFPQEAWKTNVLATKGLLEACVRANVAVFVNVSTDKAADPRTVLGHTKRIGERMVAHVAVNTGQRYYSVRFGNVWDSRGSVAKTFRYQAEHGLPVTVTDPQATRYFMDTAQAVDLVISTMRGAEGGQTLILDMGEPVSILERAHEIVEHCGSDSPIVFTHLRGAEKQRESLVDVRETPSRWLRPGVTSVRVAPLDPLRLGAAYESSDRFAED